MNADFRRSEKNQRALRLKSSAYICVYLRPISCGLLALCTTCLSLAACAPLRAPAPTQPALVSLAITADGKTQTVAVPANLTVREALAQAGLTLGDLDRLTPPAYTTVSAGLAIQVTRVVEKFETEQSVLPYTSQTVKNEGLPAGERRLLQAGANGLEEITYRTVFEDGVQTARSLVKRVVLTSPAPEIIMIGSQSSFTIVPITGTLAYLNGNNAWIMRQNSSQRLPLTTTGDLDGRVFNLSHDGQWLLFTRAVSETAGASPNFNTLWAITTTVGAQPLDLKISNALYAEWSPVEPRAFAYSTAEKTISAPGWQANNDLWLASWTMTKKLQPTALFTTTQILDTSSGGTYGWWGTGFAYSPTGGAIAYARTDSIGVIDLATRSQSELAQFTAYNTHADWAWHPTLNWSPDGSFLYTVTHGAPIGLEALEDSPVFNVTALANQFQVNLVPRAGMFANPVVSPLQPSTTAEQPFQIAFLQAGDPNSSPFSRYRLGVMDRDGSNVHSIFPPEDQPGLSANQTVAWSPDGSLLAVIYAGNLWLVAADTDVSQQLTGDGLSAYPQWSK